MSLVPKFLSAVLPLLPLLSIGCIRHHVPPPMNEVVNEPNELPSEIPGERVVTSGRPTTGRYAATQPTGFPRTRIVVRVAEGGVIRRFWALSTCPRPSGEVLAGPTYWPSEDQAFRRPNWVNVWLEPGEFLWNTALLPYRVIETPPWAKIVYSPAGGVHGWRNVEQTGVLYREKD